MPVVIHMQGDAGRQPKDAVNYRQGGDVCHVCARFMPAADGSETGTCSKVEGAINGHDLCDVFLRAGHAAEEEREGEGGREGSQMSGMAENLQRRGMISDKAMAGLRGRGD